MSSLITSNSLPISRLVRQQMRLLLRKSFLLINRLQSGIKKYCICQILRIVVFIRRPCLAVMYHEVNWVAV